MEFVNPIQFNSWIGFISGGQTLEYFILVSNCSEYSTELSGSGLQPTGSRRDADPSIT